MLRRSALEILTVGAIFLLAACSIKVGNPKQPKDGGEDTKLVDIPSLEFTVDDSEFENIGSGSLKQFADAFNRGSFLQRRTLRDLNTLVGKLNEEELKAGTKLQFATAGGTVDGFIQNDGDKYHATFCVDDEPMLVLKWSSANDDLEIVRDPNVDPYGVNTGDAEFFMKEHLILKHDGNNADLAMYYAGRHASSLFAPTLNFSVELYRLKRDEKEVFTLFGIADRRQKLETEDSTPVDAAIARRTDSANNFDRMVAYQKFPILCPGTFDYENQETPGWCAGATSEGRLERSTEEEVGVFWADYREEIGFIEPSEYKLVEFDQDACAVTK